METKTFRGMQCRRMGQSGLWVSAIGLGTWKWGDPSYDGSRVGDHEGFKILDRNLDLVESLDAIAKRKGCSIAQLAIAWLLSHDVVSSVIAGVTRMEQLEDNVKAPSVELTKEDLKELDEISAG